MSKRKLRKINEQGPYAGKNIKVFDSTGKAVPKTDLAGSQTNAYFQSLLQKDQSENVLMLQGEEKEAGDYIDQVRRNMQATRDQDAQIAREKLTTKRIKKKVYLKKLMGQDT